MSDTIKCYFIDSRRHKIPYILVKTIIIYIKMFDRILINDSGTNMNNFI